MNNYRNVFGFYAPPKVYDVGISSDMLNQVYAHQNKTQWCWSASISMVLRYYGFEISQHEFAQQVCGVDIFGNPGNCPAYPTEISRALNVYGNDDNGKAFAVEAPLRSGSPDLSFMLEQLLCDRPIIIGYYNPDFRSGHAVVITGCRCEDIGGTTYIRQLYVRDPWKDAANIIHRGRKVIDNVPEFLSRVHSHWYVEVTAYPGYKFNIA